MNTRLSKQLAEEAVVKAYIEKRDTLSVEVGRLQSTIEGLVSMKSGVEQATLELEKRSKELEQSVQTYTEKLADLVLELGSKNSELRKRESELGSLEKALAEKELEWKSLMVKVADEESQLVEVESVISAKTTLATERIKELNEEIAKLESIRDEKMNEYTTWKEEMEKKDGELVEREARVEERMTQAAQKEEDTSVLRRRLAKIAQDNNIHFSIKL